MIRVILEPEAAAYIRQRGGHLILFQATVTGCCGIGAAPEMMIEVGVPRQPPEAYQTLVTDGVALHIDRALAAASHEVRISLNRFLGLRSLSLSLQGG